LSGWWNDSAYQDSSGSPAVLPLRGRGRSFAALVERYSGERVLAASILDALLRVKAVRRTPDGRVQALSRSYATVRWNPDGGIAFYVFETSNTEDDSPEAEPSAPRPKRAKRPARRKR